MSGFHGRKHGNGFPLWIQLATLPAIVLLFVLIAWIARR